MPHNHLIIQAYLQSNSIPLTSNFIVKKGSSVTIQDLKFKYKVISNIKKFKNGLFVQKSLPKFPKNHPKYFSQLKSS